VPCSQSRTAQTRPLTASLPSSPRPACSKVNGNGVCPPMQRALARRHACPSLPSLRRTIEQQHHHHRPPLPHLHQPHCSLIAAALFETPCIDIALGRLRVLACFTSPAFLSRCPPRPPFSRPQRQLPRFPLPCLGAPKTSGGHCLSAPIASRTRLHAFQNAAARIVSRPIRRQACACIAILPNYRHPWLHTKLNSR